MKAYRATGTFRSGKHDQPYTLDVVAASEEEATEQVYSNFGSRHRAKRRFVIIDTISEINPSGLDRAEGDIPLQELVVS